jgi:hypothetical protein
MIKININDTEKGDQEFNFETEPNYSDFISSDSGLKDFHHVAKIVSSSDKVSGYSYESTHEDWKTHNGWVYMLTVADKVAKIGMTEVTLGSRFSSYQAGTRESREKGTCSVTNFYCSEVIRQALDAGHEVNVYASKVPEAVSILNVLGEQVSVRSKVAYMYEAKLLERFEKKYESKPLLCRNSSKEK